MHDDDIDVDVDEDDIDVDSYELNSVGCKLDIRKCIIRCLHQYCVCIHLFTSCL